MYNDGYVVVSMTKRLSEIELTRMIAEIAPLKCWKVGLYYGSMAYFHMKDRILETASDGSDRWVGSSTLSLDGDVWSVHDCGVELTNSSIITRDFAETTLDYKFSGQELLSFRSDKSSDNLSVLFSGDLEILISQKVSEEDMTEDLMTLTMPNGQIVCLSKAAGLFLSDETIEASAKLWRQKHQH